MSGINKQKNKTRFGKDIVKNKLSKICAVICIICALLSITALVLLIIHSKDGTYITSFSLYAGFLSAFYIITSIYHFFPFSYNAKKIFFRLSHAFFIIVVWGVYMPLCLVTLKGGWGWTFFGIITALAVVGISVRSSLAYRWRGASETIYYLMLNWIWIIAINKIIESTGEYGMVLYLTGFLVLTIAMVFHNLAMYEINKRYNLFLPIFYFLLIVSNTCHAIFMFKYIL